ncbi:MAG TPA: branched-chain amino acid ABC transporter permease [Aggregatilineales bacterium]|nr:branched-chain amino acid ABC transporter permease [Anaerolineales bacterium]HRE48322.1 branched-chain amino acid ABC transporter permease [Aggregatilineales bacterium]
MIANEFLQQVANAVALGAIYSLFALGYALVFSILGTLNLAHSAVFMWGAYFGLYSVLEWKLPLLIAFPIAMIGAGVLGVAVDTVAFRPLRRRNAPRIAQLIASIGAATLLVSIAQLVFTPDPRRFPFDILPAGAIPGLPFRVTLIQVIVLVTALVLMSLLNLIVTRTKLGQAMRAVAFNARTASLLGVNVGRIFASTFFLAGALAGIAGMLYGLTYNSVLPFMGDQVALKGLTAIILGGMGSIPGAVLGGFTVSGLERLSVAVGGSNYRDAVVFVILFLMLIVRPQGLIGQKDVTRA